MQCGSSGSTIAFAVCLHSGIREYACHAGSSIAAISGQGVEDWLRGPHIEPPEVIPNSHCRSNKGPAEAGKGIPHAADEDFFIPGAASEGNDRDKGAVIHSVHGGSEGFLLGSRTNQVLEQPNVTYSLFAYPKLDNFGGMHALLFL